MKSKYEFRKSKMMMASNSRVWHIICLLLIVVFFCPFAYGKVIYVDDDAVGANDGSSWQNAYTFLQDALTDAEATNKPVEVCVGQGVYKPDQGIGITLGDRRTSFHLKNSVAIKGGYAGVNEPEPDIRDVGLFQTILSGDLSGNDIDVNNPGNLYDLPDRYDDSEIVVTCSNTDSTAVLDSFTITGGYISVIAYRLGGGPSGGAGMLISSGSPTLINCTFTDNATTNSGGGLLIYDDSNPTLLNCKFIRNYAGSGGGLFSSTSSPTLINCIFSDNYAQHQGGGIYNVSGNPILTNCTFRRNSTYGSRNKGGGMYNRNSSIVLTNCTFIENSAATGGGMFNKDCNTELNMCEFVGNTASSYSGAVSNSGQLIVKGCVFKENYPGAVEDGGSPIGPIFTDCTFSGNSSPYDGGAVCVYMATFSHCLFAGNRSLGEHRTGGAVYSFSTATFNNCTFNNNWADSGCAIDIGGRAYVNNCIFWGSEDQIRTDNSYQFLVNYSDIQGGWTWPGEGNIDADPFFVDPGFWADADDPNIAVEPNDPNAVWIDGDYHLKSQAGRWDPASESWIQDDVTSPCIDAGDPNSPIGSEPFPNGGIINMGAYGGTAEASKSLSGKSIYIFMPEQSMVFQTGGIAGVNGAYILTGQFQLTTDFGAGKARFSNVEAIATDYSEPVRKLDPNDVFNLTGLTGTISKDGSIQFTGQTTDESDVILYITLSDERISLKGQTIPPPNSADFFIFNLDAVAKRKYGGGMGEINDPYLIYTAEHLKTLGAEPNDWYKHFKLMADIDLAGYSYDHALIAPDIDTDEYYFQGTPFAGVFDGNGHTISHLTITGVSCLGLFGELAYGAELKDLGIMDVNISGSGDFVGGLLGRNSWGAVVIRCYSTGTVNGDDNIGGLVGNNHGHVTQCYSTSSASGDYIIGGLLGSNEKEATLTNCYSTGAVNGNDAVAGLLGFNLGEVTHCYCAGTVTGNQRVGGLVGWNYGAIASNFWDIQTSGRTNMCGSQEESASGCDDSSGLITDEMYAVSTFLEAGWDFVDETENGTDNIWWIEEGKDYPRLWWEAMK